MSADKNRDNHDQPETLSRRRAELHVNIAIVTSSYALWKGDASAAAGLFVRDFSAALADLGHSVRVVTQAKSGRTPEPPPGVDLHPYPWPGRDRPLAQLKLTNPLDLWSAYRVISNGQRALAQLHQAQPFDHVLAMWAVPAGLIAQHLNKRSGVPYSTWCLGSDIWSYGKTPILKQMVGRVLRKSTHCFADGIQLAEDAERLAQRSIQFLPSSRSLDKNVAAIDRPSDQTTRFLFLGRYARVKGVDILLQAMAKFVENHPDSFLQLLGGGPLRSELEQLAAEHHLEKHVDVGPLADEPLVVSHMKAADAVIIPSRMESIPVVLSDALQMGKPVIVTNVGDMGRLIRQTPAGLVVPPDDAGLLAQAMQIMATRPTGHFDQHVAELAAQFDIATTAAQFVEEISR